jgi:hypothetical protein
MRRTVMWWILALAALGLACPGSTAGGNDAGTDDAGSASDGGGLSDAGDNADGGTGLDGGTADSGTNNDAGLPYCSRATAPVVTIDFPASCAGFTPCGGDPVGSWHYSAVCVDSPFDAIQAACPTLTVSNASGTVQGCTVFAGAASSGFLYRDLTWSISGTVNLPPSCTPSGCAQAQSALDVIYPGSTCSTASDGGCNCAVTRTGGAQGPATDYTVTRTTLGITQDSRTFDLCVTPGTSLMHHETTSSGADPGFWSMVPN